MLDLGIQEKKGGEYRLRKEIIQPQDYSLEDRCGGEGHV